MECEAKLYLSINDNFRTVFVVLQAFDWFNISFFSLIWLTKTHNKKQSLFFWKEKTFKFESAKVSSNLTNQICSIKPSKGVTWKFNFVDNQNVIKWSNSTKCNSNAFWVIKIEIKIKQKCFKPKPSNDIDREIPSWM